MSKMPRFNSVLVANRGEIACRIIKTAKRLGYRTIAVYSEADATAPHVKMADNAVAIGPSPVSESYLSAEKIIQAAKESGAEAIHPGYGFLSENAEFAQLCSDAELVFVGPSADAIEIMGNKAAAKHRMQEAGVPCVPGYLGADQGNDLESDQSDDVLVSEAEKIGFPLMVKAAAGGGGRGLRLVTEASSLLSAIKLARSEAENAFGSGQLILEKAIVEPRHVEVQVLADEFGNVIHLGERDCSVQRRHQKVVEEAPCPVMTAELRNNMGTAAVAAAQNIDYVGAGTVEFLLDGNGDFYFLEMNTRLQVEHPVTEMITGVDLVEQQLSVAQGEPLTLSQQDVEIDGHAIEVRLYTEDPANDFLPTAGRIKNWRAGEGDGVRVDAGVESGQEISPYYDPMIAKVIAHGASRDIARRRLLKALQRTSLIGVKHNKFFLQGCLEKPSFISGGATTAFIDAEFDTEELKVQDPSFEQAAIAAVLDAELSFEDKQAKSLSGVSQLQNWSSASPLVCRRAYEFAASSFELNIICKRDSYSVSSKDQPDISLPIEIDSVESGRAHLNVNGEGHVVNYLWSDHGNIHIEFDSLQADFEDQLVNTASQDDSQASGQVRAPMHGQVLEILVSPEQAVSKGESLLVLEAMKMQHQILATANGTVTTVNVNAGEQVAVADVLIELDID